MWFFEKEVPEVKQGESAFGVDVFDTVCALAQIGFIAYVIYVGMSVIRGAEHEENLLNKKLYRKAMSSPDSGD